MAVFLATGNAGSRPPSTKHPTQNLRKNTNARNSHHRHHRHRHNHHQQQQQQEQGEQQTTTTTDDLRDNALPVIEGKTSTYSCVIAKYRRCVDAHGVVLEDRKADFDAWYWFVDRMLSAINPEKTRFGRTNQERRKSSLIGTVFTVSDEAFALLLLYNYEGYWRQTEQLKRDGVTKDEMRASKTVRARYTTSHGGRSRLGWSDEGIKKYNELYDMVHSLRENDMSGQQCDVAWQREYWRRNNLHGKKRKKKKAATANTDAGSVPRVPLAHQALYDGGLSVSGGAVAL